MISCCVTNCDVTRKHNPNKYAFYRFPVRPELRKKWMRAVNMKDRIVTRNTLICRKHFDRRCFRLRNNKHMLLRNSIPTVFVPIKVKQMRSARLPNIQVKTRPQRSQTEMKLVIRNESLKQKLVEKTKAYKCVKQKTKRMQERITSLKQVIKDLLRNITNEVEMDTSQINNTAKNNYAVIDCSD